MSKSSNNIISENYNRVIKVSGNPPVHLHELLLDKEDKKYPKMNLDNSIKMFKKTVSLPSSCY